MPDLHETQMGRRLIEGTLPSLVESVDKMTDALVAMNRTVPYGTLYEALEELRCDEDILTDDERQVLSEAHAIVQEHQVRSSE